MIDLINLNKEIKPFSKTFSDNIEIKIEFIYI